MKILLHDKVAAQIEVYIKESSFDYNSRLPSIESLAKTFSVSKAIMQKAVKILCGKGIIEARSGKGITVKTVLARPKKSKRVGLVILQPPAYVNKSKIYPGKVVDTVRHDLAKAGYKLEIFSLENVEALTIAETVRKARFDGLILLEVDNDYLVRELRGHQLPIVSMDYDAFRLGVSSVCFDNTTGTFDAVDHLIRVGHRHITFMLPNLTWQTPGTNPYLNKVQDERIIGYRLAMHHAGLVQRIFEYTRWDTRSQLLEVFGPRPAPTALVFVDDIQAETIIRLAADMGFRIPEDISVAGFGDSGREYAPGRRLASVRVDMTGMGAAAARLLLDEMAVGERRLKRIILPVEFIPGDSIAQIIETNVTKGM